MAGYIGSKAVNLSTTGADINGNANVDGTLDVTGAFTSLGIDDNAASTAVTIDASGNVGIGTASPSELIEIEDGNMLFTNTVSNDSRIYFTHTTTASRRSYIGALEATGTGNSLIFAPNANGFDAAEAMRIDASGSVLVGQSSTTNPAGANTVGHALTASGLFSITRDADFAGNFNRKTSDGDIIRFNKDGTTVGSIGSIGGVLSYIVLDPRSGGVGFRGTNTNAILAANNAGAGTDNLTDLGAPAFRFDDIYATNGTIQTSDRNEKEAIASLTPTEMLVAARLSTSFKNFKWKDAVAEKGLDAARLHSGIIAQDVQDAFAAEGLDAGDYAMFISSTWWETQTDVPAVEAVAEVVDEEGNVVTEAVEAKEAYTRTDTYDTLEEAPVGATERTRLGVRYPELLAFVAAYNDQRFLAIEARLTALEVTP